MKISLIKLILLFVFGLGFLFLAFIAIGENIASKGKYPRFTKWWRKNWVGEEDELN